MGNKLPGARTTRFLSNEKVSVGNINTVVIARENLELKNSGRRLYNSAMKRYYNESSSRMGKSIN